MPTRWRPQSKLGFESQPIKQLQQFENPILKWGASSRWPFRPNSAWGRIETTTITKTHPTLFLRIFTYEISQIKLFQHPIFSSMIWLYDPVFSVCSRFWTVLWFLSRYFESFYLLCFKLLILWSMRVLFICFSILILSFSTVRPSWWTQ